MAPKYIVKNVYCLLMIAGPVAATSCKPLKDQSEGSMALEVSALGGGQGYVAMALGKFRQTAQDKAQDYAKGRLTALATNDQEREAFVNLACQQLGPLFRKNCAKVHKIANGTAGFSQALGADISEAAMGVKAVVSNPEQAAESLFEASLSAIKDPQGTKEALISAAKALKDDLVECAQAGDKERGQLVGHAALLIFPEAKGASLSASTMRFASKVETVATRAGALAHVTTELRKNAENCRDVRGQNGEIIGKALVVGVPVEDQGQIVAE